MSMGPFAQCGPHLLAGGVIDFTLRAWRARPGRGRGRIQKHVSIEAPSDPAGLVGRSDAKEHVHCLLTTLIDFSVKRGIPFPHTECLNQVLLRNKHFCHRHTTANLGEGTGDLSKA